MLAWRRRKKAPERVFAHGTTDGVCNAGTARESRGKRCSDCSASYGGQQGSELLPTPPRETKWIRDVATPVQGVQTGHSDENSWVAAASDGGAYPGGDGKRRIITAHGRGAFFNVSLNNSNGTRRTERLIGLDGLFAADGGCCGSRHQLREKPAAAALAATDSSRTPGFALERTDKKVHSEEKEREW